MSLALEITRELIRKSGVRDYEDPNTRAAIIAAANEIAQGLWIGDCMALPDFFKIKPGTALEIKSTGGAAIIQLASVANAAMRQSDTIDLGENWAKMWRIDTEFELAATPTAGNSVNLFGSFSNATGAGAANTSGSDSAYAGYSSNAAAASKQLEFLGAHICTTQITAIVQKGRPGVFFPKGRFLNLVVGNESGAAFHSTNTNQVIRLTPLDEIIQDLVSA